MCVHVIACKHQPFSSLVICSTIQLYRQFMCNCLNLYEPPIPDHHKLIGARDPTGALSSHERDQSTPTNPDGSPGLAAAVFCQERSCQDCIQRRSVSCREQSSHSSPPRAPNYNPTPSRQQGATNMCHDSPFCSLIESSCFVPEVVNVRQLQHKFIQYRLLSHTSSGALGTMLAVQLRCKFAPAQLRVGGSSG